MKIKLAETEDGSVYIAESADDGKFNSHKWIFDFITMMYLTGQAEIGYTCSCGSSVGELLEVNEEDMKRSEGIDFVTRWRKENRK